MPHPFPHRYETSLHRTEGRRAVLKYGEARPLDGAPPPQFDGPDGAWSPEALLLSAAELCLMTTFLALAERARLEVPGYQSASEGTLDKTADGLAFTRVVQRVRLALAPADAERGAELLKKAKKHCIVSNALKTPPELEVEVVTA
ncbi:MAG: OsmC family protein [Elusimicrobia bacterium]|nr:OsmC family protein [Elusimicrobiota bacterium]